MGTRKGQGRGGYGGFPCLVPGKVEEGWNAYLPPPALEAGANEQREAVFPATEAAAPPTSRDKYLSPSRRGESLQPE